MPRNTFLSAAIATVACLPVAAAAAENGELQPLRDEIEKLKQDHERRLARLEQPTQQPVPSRLQGSSSAGALNPAISLTLSGIYGSLQQDPAVPATGFAMNLNPRHERGFSLGETEIEIAANIDPDYRGVAVLALDPAGGVSVENAYVQTTALGNGLNVKLGRHFSGLGYLNEQHIDIWDFADQPLVYAVFWENQLADDGLQVKWLAPTDTFIELGAELGRGRGFPGSDRAKNGAGSGVLFAHAGDDIGIEHSWRVGASLHRTRAVDRVSDGVPDMNDVLVSNSFSGGSQTTGLDFVWKYAPNGNVRNSYAKLQGEYFRRKESGDLTYDTAGANIADRFSVSQSGLYLQGVYQFMPQWRTGLRYDRLDPGIAQIGALNAGNVIADYAFRPARTSLMLDYSPSEFSRLRLQLARDNSRQGLSDNQLFVQYIMSLGAHSAHSY